VDECKALVEGSESEEEPYVNPRLNEWEQRRAAWVAAGQEVGTRGLHSFPFQLNLGNSRTHSNFKLGYTVERTAQLELKWERV
jgi:hypothetical protein